MKNIPLSPVMGKERKPYPDRRNDKKEAAGIESTSVHHVQCEIFKGRVPSLIGTQPNEYQYHV